MKFAYHTWHGNEVIGLHNWILSLDKEADKIQKLRNIVNKMKIRKLLIKSIKSEGE